MIVRAELLSSDVPTPVVIPLQNCWLSWRCVQVTPRVTAVVSEPSSEKNGVQ
jgi:hypothetical protein